MYIYNEARQPTAAKPLTLSHAVDTRQHCAFEARDTRAEPRIEPESDAEAGSAAGGAAVAAARAAAALSDAACVSRHKIHGSARDVDLVWLVQ